MAVCTTNLTIDRDTASRLGILPQAIDNTLYDAFGQRQVSIIFTQLNQYHVVLEVLPNFAKTPEAMNDIYVRPHSTIANAGAPTANAATATTSGSPVPLSTFVRMQSTNTPLAVNHQGQFPVVTLSFNLAPGASLGDATKAIQQVEKDIQLPASIHASFQGTAAAFQNSLSSEPFLILAAIITVYIVLGVLYESYIHLNVAQADIDTLLQRRPRSEAGTADRGKGPRRAGGGPQFPPVVHRSAHALSRAKAAGRGRFF